MKTMQKNKGLKKRGKGLALGICAAILGTVGVAWIPQTVAWAYAESYMDADGKMVTKVFQNGDTDTVTDETDEVTAAEAENAGKSATESATEDFFVTVVQDSAADQVGYMADGNSYIYKALGLEYDEEQKAWMWKEKPVYAIWFGDAGMIIYGDVKPEGENCLHITWESGDGTATFKVQEMTKNELKKAYLAD